MDRNRNGENKLNKQVKILISVLVIAIIGVAAVVGVNAYSDFAKKEKAKNEVVAKVNGVGIIKKNFVMAKKNAVLNKLGMSDKDVLFKLVEDELVLQEAKKRGYNLSDAEAQKITDAQKAALQKSASYDKFKTFIKEVGVTENEYWKDAVIKNKNTSNRNNYKADLKIDFAKKNQIKDMNSLETKFDDYFQEVIAELMSVADLEILIPLEEKQ